MWGVLGPGRVFLPRQLSNDAARSSAVARSSGFWNLRWDDSFTRALPADPDTSSSTRKVKNCCFSWATPKPAADAQLIMVSEDAAAAIGLSSVDISSDQSTVAALAGTLPADSKLQPYAACYSGHQFGSFAGQLGDGRAIALGEVLSAAGVEDRWELQLKGAGPTPYSRRSDGLAVLRSSVREFLASESMHALGVPTTRALSLCLSGHQVVRGVHYDGTKEPGAVVCRMAPSFIRFGSFEMLYARGEVKLLRLLADYLIEHHYPELAKQQDRHAQLLRAIVHRTARLLPRRTEHRQHECCGPDTRLWALFLYERVRAYFYAKQQRPCLVRVSAALEHAEPRCGSRYSYENQPSVCKWNLRVLGTAFAPLLGEADEGVQAASQVIAEYDTEFARAMTKRFQQKLGISTWGPHDNELLTEFLQLLEDDQVDFTQGFRSLVALDPKGPPTSLAAALEVAGVEVSQRWVEWVEKFSERVSAEHDDSRIERMRLASPRYILRNWQMQRAIEAAEAGAYGPLIELHEVLKRPFDEQPEYAHYDDPSRDEARRVGVWQLS